MEVGPLIFEPILKPRVWGGRRLEHRLRKKLPAADPIGESWELADLDTDQSRVAVGPHRGKTIAEMVRLWGDDLLGRASLADGRFPLLLKFLDAAQPLSIQVHPDDDDARRSAGAVRIKNEAWYVIDAAPDSWILRGLKPGVSETSLRQAIADGNVESLLNRIPVRTGHAYYLPSGTPHALGPGVLVAEVQTPSDTTYRLFDWNRLDPGTGRPRPLHIEEALSSIRYDDVPRDAEHPQHLASVWTAVTSLIRCDSFVIERVRMAAGVKQPITYDEMVIWMILEGYGKIEWGSRKLSMPFGVGDTVVLPAAMKNACVRVDESSLWLEVSLPIRSSLEGFARPDRASLGQPPYHNLIPLKITGRHEKEPSDSNRSDQPT